MSAYGTCCLEKSIEVSGLHTAFVHTTEADYSSLGEHHDFWELVFVLSGSLRITTGEKIYLAGKDQAFLHPPMEYHRHANPGPGGNEFAVLSFDAKLPQRPEGLINLTFEQTQALTLLVRELRSIHEIAGGIHIVRVRPEKELAQQELISRLEMLLIEIYCRKQEPQAQLSEYDKIVEAFSGKLEENVTSEELARALCMSNSNLKRVFAKYYQGGVMRFYRQMQMERAACYLQAGCSVCETSVKMGFASQSAFCNAFKRVYGVPPTEYLRRAQQPPEEPKQPQRC